MTLKPLVLSFSLLAFAGASAFADEKKQSQQSQPQQSQAKSGQQKSFSELDRDNDGSLSRMEAAADADAKSRFEQLDQNRDQKLSRSEYQDAQSQATSKGQQGQSAGTGASGGKQSAAQQPGEMRASNLEGTQVVNAKGEEIGDIKDIVIDLNSGKVHAAVLGFGGILGIGEEHFAFPINELKPGKQANQVVMNIDKQKLENREGFSQSQWPGMDDKYWTRVGGKQAAAGGTEGKMNLVRASELEGKEVQDKSGQKVGKVQDVVVGLQNGQVKNYVVELEGGGQANVQGKALKASGTDNRLVLDVDAKQLKQQAQRSGEQRRSAGAGAGRSQSTPQAGEPQSGEKPSERQPSDKSK